MFDYVLKKINGTFKFMYRNRNFLNFEVRKMLVNSLIQPRFDYACNTWYRCIGKTKQVQLQKCQNKCIRFICDLPARHHIVFKNFLKLKYLTVAKRVDYLTLCNMHSIIYNTCPDYLKNLITVSGHTHNTRSNFKAVVIPHVKTQGKLSFYYNASKLWNSLGNEIKLCNKKPKFKYLCKNYLMDSMESISNNDFIY